jgi:hypothetical protein
MIGWWWESICDDENCDKEKSCRHKTKNDYCKKHCPKCKNANKIINR